MQTVQLSPGKSLQIWVVETQPLKDRDCQVELKKKKVQLYVLQETHFKHRKSHRLKVNGWRKTLHVNPNQKKAAVAISV